MAKLLDLFCALWMNDRGRVIPDEIAWEIGRLHGLDEASRSPEVERKLRKFRSGTPEFRRLFVLYTWTQRREESKGGE